MYGKSKGLVRKIKSNKGIFEVGKHGVYRICLNGNGTADIITYGGNIFTVKLKKVLDENSVASNTRVCNYKETY